MRRVIALALGAALVTGVASADDVAIGGEWRLEGPDYSGTATVTQAGNKVVARLSIVRNGKTSLARLRGTLENGVLVGHRSVPAGIVGALDGGGVKWVPVRYGVSADRIEGRYGATTERLTRTLPRKKFPLRKLWTEHLGQLTGTSKNPLDAIGIGRGTDLGSSFVRDGKLVILFGDSLNPGDEAARDEDSAATCDPAWGGIPKLEWLTRDGRFVAIRPPGHESKTMNVPVEGVPIGEKTYIFFASGWDGSGYARSVLARGEGLDLGNLVVDHAVASSKFVNVSVVRDGDKLLIYGSGPYRGSAVYLARVAVDRLADRAAWRYWDGTTWTQGEESAKELFEERSVGELCVRRHEGLGAYVMTYNATSPRGIHLRWAEAPTGPWSSPLNVFDPWADRGYEHFLHAKESVTGFADGLAPPGNEEDWGGEYGPYLVPSWFESADGVHSVVFLLSSWVPYQVHVVKTVLAEEGAKDLPRPVKGAGLPRAKLENGDFSSGDLRGWHGEGDSFAVFGERKLTTHVLPRGDAAVGKLWQDFTVDALTSELTFSIHGGDGVVELIHAGEVVRTVRGRRTNDQEVKVRWRLESFRGDTVRLQIRDDEAGPWGFIGVSGFELR